MTITIILICLLIIVVVQYIALYEKNKEIITLKEILKQREMEIAKIILGKIQTVLSIDTKEKENVNRKCNRSNKTKSSANA